MTDAILDTALGWPKRVLDNCLHGGYAWPHASAALALCGGLSALIRKLPDTDRVL